MRGSRWLGIALFLLSVSFTPASLLAFRYTNLAVRVFYRIAAIWLGVLSFVFAAAVLSWMVYALALLAHLNPAFHRIVEVLFTTAIVFGLYAVFNAQWTRITRIRITLPNLPAIWKGRKAALISDLHLGPVRNGNFLRRIVSTVLKEEPHAVFIAGDLYDGTAIDAHEAAKPLQAFTKTPSGAFFVAGNHEQFRDENQYLNAVSAAGLRVLNGEKVDLDGLQLAGVSYRDARHPSFFATTLQKLGIDRKRASILLAHAPDHPEVAEAAGFSLQLSGHTHLGQFIPWSWIARRIYRQFVYGLSRIGNMQVFTSSGVGTWGPPLRLGSNPEIVMLHFE